MGAYSHLAVILLLSPFALVILHALLSRVYMALRPGASIQLVCIGAVLLGNLALYAVVTRFAFNGAPANPSAWAYSFIVYNAIGYTYFHLFNMSETARRIRIIHEIRKAGRLSGGDIARLYGTDDMFDVRIERLTKMGQIRKEAEYFVLNGYFFYVVAWVVYVWAALLGTPMVIKGKS